MSIFGGWVGGGAWLNELVTAAGRLSATFSSVAALGLFSLLHSVWPIPRRQPTKKANQCESCFLLLLPATGLLSLVADHSLPSDGRREKVCEDFFGRVGGGRVS